MTPFEQFAADFRNKRVLIFGLGVQGRGVGDAKLFAEVGAQVTVTDIKNHEELQPSLKKLQEYEITYLLGGHTEVNLYDFDVVIRNASVSWVHPLLIQARDMEIPIETDETLFVDYAKPQKCVGITGTRGKSTTTHLIYHLLSNHFSKVIEAGNISPTPSLELLRNFDPEAWYVFEFSSWQLQPMHYNEWSPKYAVLTNIYPDHLLDRTYEEYQHDKAAIFLYQQPEDYVFFNRDNPESKKLAQNAPGQVCWFSSEDTQELPIPKSLVGTHNRENIAAAVSLARILGVDTIEAHLATFRSLPFRLEEITNIDGSPIINDTTSTTPIAATKALAAYPNSVVILGGTTKKLPVEELIKTANDLADKIILLSGSGTDEIKSKLLADKVVGEFSSLKSAFEQALKVKKPNQAILFTPGFTSFGLFTNEFDRGEQFNQIVHEYENKTN